MSRLRHLFRLGRRPVEDLAAGRPSEDMGGSDFESGANAGEPPEHLAAALGGDLLIEHVNEPVSSDSI